MICLKHVFLCIFLFLDFVLVVLFFVPHLLSILGTLEADTDRRPTLKITMVLEVVLVLIYHIDDGDGGLNYDEEETNEKPTSDLRFNWN